MMVMERRLEMWWEVRVWIHCRFDKNLMRRVGCIDMGGLCGFRFWRWTQMGVGRGRF